MFEDAKVLLWLALAIYVVAVIAPIAFILVSRYIGIRRLKAHEAVMAALAKSHHRPKLSPEELDQLYHQVKQELEQQGYQETHRGLFVQRAV